MPVVEPACALAVKVDGHKVDGGWKILSQVGPRSYERAIQDINAAIRCHRKHRSLK